MFIRSAIPVVVICLVASFVCDAAVPTTLDDRNNSFTAAVNGDMIKIAISRFGFRPQNVVPMRFWFGEYLLYPNFYDSRIENVRRYDRRRNDFRIGLDFGRYTLNIKIDNLALTPRLRDMIDMFQTDHTETLAIGNLSLLDHDAYIASGEQAGFTLKGSTRTRCPICPYCPAPITCPPQLTCLKCVPLICPPTSPPATTTTTTTPWSTTTTSTTTTRSPPPSSGTMTNPVPVPKCALPKCVSIGQLLDLDDTDWTWTSTKLTPSQCYSICARRVELKGMTSLPSPPLSTATTTVVNRTDTCVLIGATVGLLTGILFFIVMHLCFYMFVRRHRKTVVGSVFYKKKPKGAHYTLAADADTNTTDSLALSRPAATMEGDDEQRGLFLNPIIPQNDLQIRDPDVAVVPRTLPVSVKKGG